MHSCIYEGQVRHSRARPVAHSFRYRMFQMYLDLDELPEAFEGRWLWSSRRAAAARFKRSDHYGDAGVPLADSIRELIHSRTGCRQSGPIRLLTHLRYFGYCFNPVSFYYCYDDDGETLRWIVAEVNNTPWGEQYCYVVPAGDGLKTGVLSHATDKRMHVSPFMPMDIDYDWHFGIPSERLTVFMASSVHGKRIFDASLTLKRRPISGPALARVLLSYPIMTLRVMIAIHWQALRLWMKRCPVYVHPDKQQGLETRS